MAGLEASGIGLITRAVELDGQKRYTESLICYQEGIQLLMNVIKGRIQILYNSSKSIGRSQILFMKFLSHKRSFLFYRCSTYLD